ncbi:MAG: 23S rRNA (adenine(2503)-C(2))-methyltransferase RlmN [Planctomycetota bacterium]|nr:23S rRNA (adenine(2503)-C(2))-methyltransferase RlmN [Planctomycetaceae bacterium]MDQ3330107.1 23S rRNA (adenine(2503)-C(2))-methyltransferase RlmN [Planctomycetota bacterium]
MNATSPLRPILDLTRDELIAWVEEGGERPYRADQIRKWIFGKRVTEFDEMHDVSKVVRERLKAEFRLFSSEVVKHQVAKDRTEKLLLRLQDGNHVETVLMREPNRRTVCISSQVGCAMGCVFCASGLLGVKRNLTTAEILEQVLRVDRLLGPDERLTNVVVMGIGEPLANMRHLLPALDTLNDKGGMGLGYRRITISTVGLPEKIREFASHDKPYSLAVSLHAPNDELRTRLVPVNKNIGIDAILQAADDYFAQTGRRITYEYVLLRGQNDSPEHAAELGRLLAHRAAHVNLIPMNSITDLPYAEPGEPQTRAFFDVLARYGVVTTVRKRKGADIDAACGQLRLERERGEAALVEIAAPTVADVPA